jgi:glucose/arabinose dehydrogenase
MPTSLSIFKAKLGLIRFCRTSSNICFRQCISRRSLGGKRARRRRSQQGCEPESGALWTVVNERDELGPNLVADYLTSVKDGGFYGWPYSYYGQHLDPRVQPQRPDLVEKAIVPDYTLSSHVAPLGLVFYTADSLPQKYRGGAFVGEHGSWNRPTFNGYRVVFVPFSGGHPNGKAEDVVTDFLNAERREDGRSDSPSTRPECF